MGGSREEQIQAASVSGLRLLNGSVHLAPYNEGWVGRYESEARRLRAILGDAVLALEHVGSTSVPGLSAKPVIDMILVVADSRAENTYVLPLESRDYQLRTREPDWFQHRLLAPPDIEANIHVFSSGCEEVVCMLMFRDWLRTHAEDRDLYEATKQRLAAKKWKYVQHYADAKSDVIREILARADQAQAQADGSPERLLS